MIIHIWKDYIAAFVQAVLCGRLNDSVSMQELSFRVQFDSGSLTNEPLKNIKLALYIP